VGKRGESAAHDSQFQPCRRAVRSWAFTCHSGFYSISRDSSLLGFRLDLYNIAKKCTILPTDASGHFLSLKVSDALRVPPGLIALQFCHSCPNQLSGGVSLHQSSASVRQGLGPLAVFSYSLRASVTHSTG
jgi:hypothetical protein